MNAAAQRLEECIEQLKRGELTEERLRDLGKSLEENGSRRQSLLYLHAQKPLIASLLSFVRFRFAAHCCVSGFAIRQTLLPFLRAPSRPFADFAVAVNAGWRVIRFPAQLLSSHSPDLHVTCEFILEKWE